MEKNKNVWNDKGKNIFLKILHIVCYVLSALFIVVAVYSCANANKGKEQKKSIVKDNPSKLIYLINNESDYPYYVDLSYEEECAFIQKVVTNNLISDFNAHPENYVYNGDLMYQQINSDTYLEIFQNHINDDLFGLSFGNLSVEEIAIVVEYDANQLFEMSFVYSGGVIYLDDLYYHDAEFPKFPLYTDQYGYNLYLGYDNDNLFGTMTDSTEGFIETLGDGFNSVFSVFYNDGLTTIGILMTIVVGAGLLWVLFRLVVGLIRLRG